MTTPQTTRWYSVNNMGMATLCADKADAEDVARTCDMEWPRQGQHRAVQLVEASTLDTERAARIESQQRLADMQELAAKSGLAHRMAVQRCVQAAVAEAVAAEREALLETLGEADVLVVNFMRVAGIDKHAARKCADVVRELVSNHADGDRARGTA